MIRFYLGHKENRQRVYREFVEDARNGQPCLFLVPEQFTVHAEQRLMQLHPQGFGGCCEVVSFKRLARRIMIACGRSFANQPDNAVRSVMMMRAFMALRDQLRFYASARLSEGFIAQLCRVDEQMRRSCVTPEELEAAAARLDTAQEKLSELAKIVGLYRSMMEQREFSDDEQQQAATLLDEEEVFAGYRIYVDGFYYFSPAELALLDRLMRNNEIIFAFPGADSPQQEAERETIFARPIRTRQQLRRLAGAQGVVVQETRIGEVDLDPAFSHMRQWLFADKPESYQDRVEHIHLHTAADSFGEAEYVASQIARLRRKGYRDGEIAVICRDENQYKGVLDSIFQMHGISVFTDTRTHLQTKPLALLLTTALDIAAGDFTTEDVLTHIKTGLTRLLDADLGRMQRYCTIWEPLPGQWFGDFTDHPDGFTARITEQSNQVLAQINEDRRRIIEPIESIKKALKSTVGDVCRALYRYMESTDVAQRLKEQTLLLDKQGEHARAQECEQTWEIMGKVLDALYTAVGDEPTDADTFRQLWKCALAGYDIGRIPTSVDAVLTGRVDHIRTISCRAVFVIGVNAGTFPAAQTEHDLVHAGDRELLQTVGVEWEEGASERSQDEWFYAYLAFTMPEQELFVSYHQLSDDHQPALPSEFFDQLRQLFPQASVTVGEIQPEDRAAAFDRLVSGGFADEGLMAYFERLPQYRQQITRARHSQQIGKEDTAHSAVLEQRIKAEGLSVSPTSLNVLTDCKFRYFCRYVLHLKPVERAEMSSRETGTFVHDILEKVLGDYAKQSQTPIWQEQRDAVYQKVDARIEEYLQDYFSGTDRSSRFHYLFGRMREVVRELVDRLCDEFAQSAFCAKDFELKIERGGLVEPIRVEFDGGSICVEGTIDRIDTMQTETGQFLRIVDYKTGTKEFNFDDIYNGYATQMLWYLFSLMENGGERYGMLLRPAGVLYYPATLPYYSVDADEALPQAERMEELLAKQSAQNGLLVRDIQVLQAMEKDLDGRFIRTTLKNDTLTGHVIPEEGFTLLGNHLIEQIRQLGQELLTGDVTPRPLVGGHDACQYCDYAAICGYENGCGRHRKYRKYKGSELERKVSELSE